MLEEESNTDDSLAEDEDVGGDADPSSSAGTTKTTTSSSSGSTHRAASRQLRGKNEPVLSKERVVMVMSDSRKITLAFYPESAPETSAHILELFRKGLYETDDFFRVDKGFVAQTSEVLRRRTPIPEELKALAAKTVPGEFQKQDWPASTRLSLNSNGSDGDSSEQSVRHKEGVLSLARFEDPDSGSSSFSIILGDAPHLDGQYTVRQNIIHTHTYHRCSVSSFSSSRARSHIHTHVHIRRE